jgi:hypothetical protein
MRKQTLGKTAALWTIWLGQTLAGEKSKVVCAFLTYPFRICYMEAYISSSRRTPPVDQYKAQVCSQTRSNPQYRLYPSPCLRLEIWFRQGCFCCHSAKALRSIPTGCFERFSPQLRSTTVGNTKAPLDQHAIVLKFWPHAEKAARRAVGARKMVLRATVGASAMVTVMETSLC